MKITRIADPKLEEVWRASDPSIGFTAFIAIHSTQRGPSIGGVRFRKYPDEKAALEDAKRLAHAMTLKSALADLPSGGGKGVMLVPEGEFDRKRFYQAFAEFVNHLEGRYISAKDAGTTTDDVATMKKVTRWVGGAPSSEGGRGDPSPVTALGVIAGLKATWEELSGSKDLSGMRVVIQGLGAVGSKLAKGLSERGCEIWATEVNPQKLVQGAQKWGLHSLIPEMALNQEADLLVPCALGKVFNNESIPALQVKGIAGSANDQLEDADRDAQQLHERGILYAPDFVVNAGGIIHIAAEFHEEAAEATEKRVEGIGKTLREIFQQARSEKISPYRAAVKIAQNRLK